MSIWIGRAICLIIGAAFGAVIMACMAAAGKADEQVEKDRKLDELYYHMAVLFAALCRAYPDRSWISVHHHDFTMYDGYFVAGVTTPQGQFTYHCRLDYWDLFKGVEKRATAPPWDGHTGKDVTRLLSLKAPFDSRITSTTLVKGGSPGGRKHDLHSRLDR